MAARSFSNAKLISALFDGVSTAINRRGISTGAQGVASVVRGGSRSGLLKQGGEKGIMKEGSENSWVPDPVTGYYRPASGSVEVDVADLREMLLTNKINQQ